MLAAQDYTLQNGAIMTKQEVFKQNVESVANSGLAFAEQDKGVFRLDTERGAVIFYAKTGNWQHRGRKGHTFETLVSWLKKEKLA